MCWVLGFYLNSLDRLLMGLWRGIDIRFVWLKKKKMYFDYNVGCGLENGRNGFGEVRSYCRRLIKK